MWKRICITLGRVESVMRISNQLTTSSILDIGMTRKNACLICKRTTLVFSIIFIILALSFTNRINYFCSGHSDINLSNIINFVFEQSGIRNLQQYRYA